MSSLVKLSTGLDTGAGDVELRKKDDEDYSAAVVFSIFVSERSLFGCQCQTNQGLYSFYES